MATVTLKNQLNLDGSPTRKKINEWIGSGTKSNLLEVVKGPENVGNGCPNSQTRLLAATHQRHPTGNIHAWKEERCILVKENLSDDDVKSYNICPYVNVPNDQWSDDSHLKNATTFTQCVRNSGTPCTSASEETEAGLVQDREACHDLMNERSLWTGPDATPFDFISFREFTDKDGNTDTECKSFLQEDNSEEIQISPGIISGGDPRETTNSSSTFGRVLPQQGKFNHTAPATKLDAAICGTSKDSFVPGTEGQAPCYAPSKKETEKTESEFPKYVKSAYYDNGPKKKGKGWDRGDRYTNNTFCTYPTDTLLNYNQVVGQTTDENVDSDPTLMANYCFSPETDKSLIPPELDSAPKALSRAPLGSSDKASRDICSDFFNTTQEYKNMYDDKARQYCDDILIYNENNPNFDYTKTGCQCILDTEKHGYAPALQAILTTPGLNQSAACVWEPCTLPQNLNTFEDKEKECSTPECLSLVNITQSEIGSGYFNQNLNCSGDKCPECDEGLVCNESTNFMCSASCKDTGCPSDTQCNSDTDTCEPFSNDGETKSGQDAGSTPEKPPEEPPGTSSSKETDTTLILIIIGGVVGLFFILMIGWWLIKKKRSS